MSRTAIIFVLSILTFWHVAASSEVLINASGGEFCSYQKIGDIGRTRQVACVLPHVKGQKVMISYIPTTGFYKGYKQRLVLVRENNDTCTLFIQKNGELKLITQQICMRVKDEDRLHMEIDPFGDLYFQNFDSKNGKKERSKNKIVRIAQVMSSLT